MLSTDILAPYERLPLFLRGLNDDYRRLRDDPEKWQQYLAERQEWDSLA